MNRSLAVGKRQGVQVCQRRTLLRKTHLIRLSVGNTGDLWKTLLQVGDGIGNLDQRLFSFVDDDDVNLRMMGKKWFGGTGGIVASGHDQLPGITRFDLLRQLKKFSGPCLKTQRQPD